MLVLTALTIRAENWTPYPDAGCIGGSTCGGVAIS